jgi:glycosyltransferase involved in cell wall biosynthesis
MRVTPNVVIAMPAFNEGEALRGFLNEISDAFEGISFHLIVVDDTSTDDTLMVLNSLVTQGLPLTTHRNLKNSGHGPSTLTALMMATEKGPRYVVSADGDGHITGGTLRNLFDQCVAADIPVVVEGVRAHRSDPWFRKLVSSATRTLIKSQSGKSPSDANTPFRVYPVEVLTTLLQQIPSHHMTPNLMMSNLVRKSHVPFPEHRRPAPHGNNVLH